MVGTERLTASTCDQTLTVCNRHCKSSTGGRTVTLPPTKGSIVIRLRPRVGLSRTLSVSVLIAGLAGGVLISDRQTQHNKAANVQAEAASVPLQGDRAPLDLNGADQQNAQSKADDAAQVAAAQAKAADEAARKNNTASRSDPRSTPTPSGPSSGGNAGPIPASCQTYTGNRATGCAVMLQSGFTIDQAPCLVSLWNRESGWNPKSSNKSSGAYGIPQAVPGNKMAVYGSDWQTNPVTQIKWGLSYIKSRYKTPCGAWSHSQSTGWY